MKDLTYMRLDSTKRLGSASLNRWTQVQLTGRTCHVIFINSIKSPIDLHLTCQ